MVADHSPGPVEGFRHNLIVSLVQKASGIAKTNVHDRVHGEKVGPGAVIQVELIRSGPESRLHRSRTAGVHLFDQPFNLVGDFVLPPFEIFDSICTRQNFAFPLMFYLVDHISEVVMGT